MCLYSYNTKPFVCDKDIVVYKLLKVNDNEFKTYYQDTSVSVDEVIKANGTLPEIPLDYSDNKIGKGVIHTYIRNNIKDVIKDDIYDDIYDDRVFAKSVIKAGTPFFVQFDMEEVATRELFISSEIIGCNNIDNKIDEITSNLRETHEIIYKLMREQIVGKDGVKVGDVLLSDRKTFVTPENITKDMSIIGVVGFINNDGIPHIISLYQEKKRWAARLPRRLASLTKSSRKYNPINIVNTYNEACNDFNGKKYTKNLFKRYSDRLDDIPALEYCVSYSTEGTKKGDWVFDSIGEVLQVIRNAYIINVTIDKINMINSNIKADKIVFGTHYWASSERSSPYAWVCFTVNAKCYGWFYKSHIFYVRPSLAIDVA